MNLSLLIHTFGRYAHLWPGMATGLENHVYSRLPIYWGTDERPEYPKGEINAVCGMPCNILFSGPGEWSDRLIRLLDKIPTDFVLYMQEDQWPTQPPPDLHKMMEIVAKHDLLRLQLSPINHYYAISQSGEIHFFNIDSKYLVSHQPSIWKKSFLLSCLEPNETPWVNEYEGTKRLKNNPDIERKIAIYPCNWYDHKCSKGKIIES